MQPCTCPYCRRPLRYSQLRHDAALQARLDALTVHCPNAPAGCGAELPRGRVGEHLAGGCPEHVIACEHCGHVAKRRELAGHDAECPAWPVPCPNAAAGCGALVPKGAVGRHLEANCEWQPGACGGCGAAVPRREWRAHALGGCPAARDCPGRPAGCDFVGGSDAELAAHLAAGCEAAAAAAAAGGSGAAGAAAAAAADEAGCLPPAELALAAGGYASRFAPLPGADATMDTDGGNSDGAAAAAAALPSPAAAAAAAGVPADVIAELESEGLLAWEDALELGLPGCSGLLGIEGLAGDEAADAAWRTVLNLGLVEVRRVQAGVGREDMPWSRARSRRRFAARSSPRACPNPQRQHQRRPRRPHPPPPPPPGAVVAGPARRRARPARALHLPRAVALLGRRRALHGRRAARLVVGPRRARRRARRAPRGGGAGPAAGRAAAAV
jgi:hypothetical protein